MEQGIMEKATNKTSMVMDSPSLFYAPVLKSAEVLVLCLGAYLLLGSLPLLLVCSQGHRSLTAPCPPPIAYRGVFPISGQPAIPEGP